MQPIRIGTRASPLALAQARQMQAAITAALGARSGEAVAVAPLTPISTEGDRIQDRRLLEVGGKALFTKDIEQALLDGRIDCAVHSLKDVPAEQTEGLVIAAYPKREDPRDGFVSHRFFAFDALPVGARLGTASLRRQAQSLQRRPDLQVVVLRGNVETRLRKIDEGEVDAALLACAGLQRLGLGHRIHETLDPIVTPPAPGQGVIALQVRTEDAGAKWATALNHPHTELVVAAERGALSALEGSCRTAMGAYAWIDGHRLHLVVEALAPDGSARWRRDDVMDIGPEPHAGAPGPARDFGLRLGLEVKAEGGDRLALDYA